MSLNPLNELKHRLDDDDTPLPKRLCLATNIVQSHHFPVAPKERIISEWIEGLLSDNKLTSDGLKRVLNWVEYDNLTGDLKSKLIQVVARYVQLNTLQTNDIQHIITFLDNATISSQLSQQIDSYLTITITMLQCLKNDDKTNDIHTHGLLNKFVKYYKESKKKLEFIIKLLEAENIETIFSFLQTECRDSVITICKEILFPIAKKSFFISYLQTLIRKDNIDELIEEKGDNIQSVLKIMSVFFEFPKNRLAEEPKFLSDFIDVFVSCYRTESQIIFAFYIMVANVLNMKQDYITPSMNMAPIIFEENDEKIKRNLFLNMLEIILQNEVDITVRLTDTFGEKISKVEIKKNFMSFLQAVMMGQLKLQGKLDKTSLQIIKATLQLDPLLIEQKMEQILPPIMAAKKSSNILESYKEMMNCLLEMLFKMSRGTLFLTQILPSVKLNLETSNTEQFELKQKLKEHAENGTDCEKLKSKLITGNDVFPQECVQMFGKLTTDLMFRQNKELLESLQKDLETHCLMMLEEGFVSPSIITLTEVLSGILSSFLKHSKMAEHTVPQNVAEEFFSMYARFENECLGKFGLCVIKLRNNPSLLNSFLNLCLSYSQLKLLNINYSHFKMDMAPQECTEVFDLGILLPCLSGDEWVKIAGKVEDDETVLILDNLLIIKAMALQLQSIINGEHDINQALSDTKSYLIKQLTTNPNILGNDKYFPRVLFTNLDQNQCKNLAKVLVKLYLNDQVNEIFNDVAISNNKLLLNALVLEVAKNVTKCFENCDSLTKALNKTEFNMAAFAKDVDMKEYLNEIIISENQDDRIKKCIDLMKILKIPYLEENYQLTAIFVLLALKKCCQAKKVKRSIDHILQNVFELSSHRPDLYQVFPVNLIFSFKDTTLIDLLTLNIKTSNQLLIVKCIIESAVKRVRSESDLVKNIVELLNSKKPKKQDDCVEAFNDPAFQISCLILPLIVKQKKAITASAFRSILANLQEKLQKNLLESFKTIDFSKNGSFTTQTGNTDDSAVESESNTAALNAMAAYMLTLSKYCESTEVEEIKNLDCLWSGLEFFVQSAIQTIKNPDSKTQHIESAIQLLNVTLRHIKKLESHDIFNKKDKLFTQIWKSIISRLSKVFQDGGCVKNCGYFEDLGLTLKFVCELASVDSFVSIFVADLANLVALKRPLQIIKDQTKSDLTNHTVSKYLWSQILKANTAGPKCGPLTKLMFNISRNLKAYIRQHYDTVHSVAVNKKRKLEVYEQDSKIVRVDDVICDILRLDLDTLAEVILSAKKMSLDYKFLDGIFELHQMVQYLLGFNNKHIKCEITWHGFFTVYDGSVAILNNLVIAREELLEDRWPCFMQCYRALTSTLCERATSHTQLDRNVEEKLAEIAHSIEKLTQAISKRKKQVSRISAYTVADICTSLEKNAPTKMVRQHLENSVATLIQASDSTYAMAFLKRALAGSAGQMTMTNMYNMYKRYHKYTGNA